MHGEDAGVPMMKKADFLTKELNSVGEKLPTPSRGEVNLLVSKMTVSSPAQLLYFPKTTEKEQEGKEESVQ